MGWVLGVLEVSLRCVEAYGPRGLSFGGFRARGVGETGTWGTSETKLRISETVQPRVLFGVRAANLHGRPG